VKEKLLHLVSKAVGAFRNHPSGPELSSDTIIAYNAARSKPNATHICHAPFSNMYFNVHGDCAPCWLTFIEPDSYPKKSIREIWFGEKYQSLRKNLLAYNLTDKCNVCLKNLQSGNYTSVLARAYDVNTPADYPSMLELELNNTCNLECVMCIGELSSSIRKNREKLPAIRSPYDEAFVTQLEEFIPHLKEIRFNGGEPFLIGLVFKIFEKIEKLNPSLKIVIATNGTVLNYKVKEWLNKLNIHINLSIDSLTPEIYETIRVNAKFDRMMEHFAFYHQYCKENNRTLCIMVNPMRNNWHEMPEFIRFVNKHKINIWFNTIHRPVEWAIWPLPSAELSNIYKTLSEIVFTKQDRPSPLSAYNISIYKNLVDVQFKNWLKEAQEREAGGEAAPDMLSEVEAEKVLLKKLSDYIYLHFNEGEEQKKYHVQQINEKLKLIEKGLLEKNINLRFYTSILSSPPDVLYNRLNSRSAQQLQKEFEHWFSQEVSV
jgi:molybdenum cofactor biosynthesis enzyme MoaA